MKRSQRSPTENEPARRGPCQHRKACRPSLITVILPALLMLTAHCRAALPLLPHEGPSFEVVYDGLPRRVLVHEPKSVLSAKGTQGVALLLVLHGGGGVPESMLSLTRGRFNELAERDSFIVAYPEGYDRGWHDARTDLRSTAHRLKVDDVGFLRRVITELAQRYRIDSERIFMTGISNGGFMSLRAACEMSDVLAGVAAVTANMPAEPREPCRPGRPVAVMFVNGTKDPLVPYDGGFVTLFFSKRGKVLSTEASVRFWRAHNECQERPSESSVPDRLPDDHTTTRRFRYEGCRASLELLRVEGGGHTWPGGRPYGTKRTIGLTSTDFQAADEIWAFFQSIKRAGEPQ